MLRFIPYLTFCALTITSLCLAQPKTRNVRQEISWLKKALVDHHVTPKVIDDAFSAAMFEKLLDDLDPDRLLFTKADLVSLEPYRSQLDDEVNGKITGFLAALKGSYRKGLVRSEQMITAAFESPLDWKKPERFDPEPDWAGDEKELTDRHRQWLKFHVLERVVELRERDSTADEGFFRSNLDDAVAHVRLTALRPLKRLLADPLSSDNQLSNTFLQAMASVFDPHSAFFSTTDYNDFVGALSTEDYFFGFMLDEDEKGNVVITALAPGGAAWKSGSLKVSDILLAVKWPNEERIDLGGMNIDDVNEILNGNRSDILEMTIRSVDGSEKNVLLRKEKLESEQNVVQSFVLDGAIRVGYIYLPDFYTRFDDEQQGGRCANDVAKEIIRLKKENIDGIILDLRFNGGGSLYEARAMAGIFIDEGPLAMVTTRDKKTVTLKDINRGTVYDGPLVLMVNGQSASASEVLAAAIQDYNRGLIVGSPTYGKATGQNLFPLEGASTTTAPAGYVKVTTQKLFRVTGKSAQGRGVTPDVIIPDIFRALNMSESQYPFALGRDSILMNPYYKPLLPLKRNELQALSRERLAVNPAFREMEKTIAWVEAEMRKTSAPQLLEWSDFLARSVAGENRQSVVANFKSSEKVFEASNGASKEQRLTVDDYARELNDRWLKLLTSDIYLQETYQVLRDHISLTKKP